MSVVGGHRKKKKQANRSYKATKQIERTLLISDYYQFIAYISLSFRALHVVSKLSFPSPVVNGCVSVVESNCVGSEVSFRRIRQQKQRAATTRSLFIMETWLHFLLSIIEIVTEIHSQRKSGLSKRKDKGK